ncbi:hypothetical protein [Bacillus cereus]|uniref:hypothetical protein n=1 Tax=Bacillus cereus TaxID=1396 RepID=UPI000BEC92BB|nr:hypothetical protein [Bacillus cereus]PEF61672.1 hypothetical protein CON35_24005 [Bacillus cereus]
MKKPLFLAISLFTVVTLAACTDETTSAHNQHGKTEEKHTQHENTEGKHTHESNEKSAEIQTKWKFTKTVEANTNNELTIQVKDDHGKPVNDFEVNHEKQLHLIAISEDLSQFGV